MRRCPAPKFARARRKSRDVDHIDVITSCIQLPTPHPTHEPSLYKGDYTSSPLVVHHFTMSSLFPRNTEVTDPSTQLPTTLAYS